jgi:hypothetical protein
MERTIDLMECPFRLNGTTAIRPETCARSCISSPIFAAPQNQQSGFLGQNLYIVFDAFSLIFPPGIDKINDLSMTSSNSDA